MYPAQHLPALQGSGHVSLPGRHAKAAGQHRKALVLEVSMCQHLWYVTPWSSQCELRYEYLIIANHVAPGDGDHGLAPHEPVSGIDEQLDVEQAQHFSEPLDRVVRAQ